MDNFWLFLPLLLLSISTHIGTLILLAQKRTLRSPYRHDTNHTSQEAEHATSIITDLGVLSALVSLAVPFTVLDVPCLVQCGLRVLAFFYACKILDLALTKADEPPTRLLRRPLSKDGEAAGRTPAPMNTTWDHTVYVWYLLTEMRYHSFSTHIAQKNRQNLHNQPLSAKLLWTLGPLILLPYLAYAYPSSAILKAATLLLIIQHALEILHTLLHPRCPEPEFYLPFSAATLSDFWSTHWQGAAAPFLQSLAYRPVLHLTGSRAYAVLATFCLTGVWHAWAAAPAVTRPWLLGAEVWVLFMGFGVGCLGEKWFWGSRQGGFVQRAVVWGWSLGFAGVCVRTLEESCRIGWVREYAGGRG
ncbi:hypothetical protein LTR62_006356 [Meristemomyces frigidus]|uniref:Wax synthase domain-containing protein n=1 Tax=Meristemomyces frigidus TaxID=1508187 RepID=A0AAN7TNG5_9PEZI|nr:hypothetical protein LTR62_006356 [Meristemomyces frigidus]